MVQRNVQASRGPAIPRLEMSSRKDGVVREYPGQGGDHGPTLAAAQTPIPGTRPTAELCPSNKMYEKERKTKNQRVADTHDNTEPSKNRRCAEEPDANVDLV